MSDSTYNPPEKFVQIEFEKLKLISEYYEFPIAVFFMPLEQWEKIRQMDRTRLKDLRKKADAFDRIREIIEEVESNARSQRESDSEPQSPSCSYPAATGVIATQPETGSGLEEGIL